MKCITRKRMASFIVICFLVGMTLMLLYWPLGMLVEAREKANINYGIINVKLLAQEILRYRKEHGFLPHVFTIEELLLKIQFDSRQLKSSAEPDLHSCIYLKGIDNYTGNIILIWRSEVKRKFFGRKKYYYELCLYDDGHLEGTSRYVE